LKSNSQEWNLWKWWEDGDGELDCWTLTHRVKQLALGDDFALWMSGEEAGIYAHGKIIGNARRARTDSRRHARRPRGEPAWDIPLATEGYLLESPIFHSKPAGDTHLRDALIRIASAEVDVISLNDSQWEALRRRMAGPQRSSRPTAEEVVVTSRRVGSPPSDAVVLTEASQRQLAFDEAQLLRDFEATYRNPLSRRRVRFPGGEWIECDAYDEVANLLIEAKASADRSDVRMAIGQLMDYRRHIGMDADVAILLPEAPGEDLCALLKDLGVRMMVRRGHTFTEL
jgi:hypothetical protein